MKKIILISLIAITGTAQAASKYKTIQSASSNSSTHHMSTSAYSANSDEGFKFEALPGLGTIASNFSWGAALEGEYGFKVGHVEQIFAGLQFGFYRASLGTVQQGVTAANTGLPLMAIGKYELAVSKHVKLVGGVGAGISFASTSFSLDKNIYGDASADSLHATQFIWQVSPGMVLNDMFVAALPLGTVDGSFYFIPSFGVRL